MRRLLHRDLGQSLVAADAVIDMDDEIARRERGELLEKRVGVLAPLRTANEAIAEHVLLGEHDDVGRSEAMIERQDDERDALVGHAERFLPALGVAGALEAVIAQQARQPLACTIRIAGEDRLPPFLSDLGEVRDDGFVDIGSGGALGGEVARAVDIEVEDGGAFGLVEGRGDMDRAVIERPGPFIGRQIERVGGERAIAAGGGAFGADAVLLIIGDRLETLLAGAAGGRVAHEHGLVGQMIEQRFEPILEQGQPMFHAREAAAVADRLIERIAGGSGAELLAIARAEALDRFLVEQGFGGGEQDEAVDAPGGALVLGREGADRFDLVAEEIEAERLFGAAGEQVDQTAADCEFAGIVDRIDADIAIGLEQRRELVETDPLAGSEARDELADAERGQRALGGGVDRGDDQPRLFGFGLQRVERGEPLGHDAQGRAGAVIGEAVPRRIAEDVELGSEEGCGRGDRAHRRLVRGDEHRGAAGAREIGQHPGQEAGRGARKGERARGGEDLLEVGHSGFQREIGT